MVAPISYDPNSSDHIHGLIMRSIRILNDHFFQGNNKVRFGIVNFYEHEYIKEALNGKGPCIWVVKNGIAYRNRPLMDSFHKVYEFMHVGYKKPNVYEKI